MSFQNYVYVTYVILTVFWINLPQNWLNSTLKIMGNIGDQLRSGPGDCGRHQIRGGYEVGDGWVARFQVCRHIFHRISLRYTNLLKNERRPELHGYYCNDLECRALSNQLNKHKVQFTLRNKDCLCFAYVNLCKSFQEFKQREETSKLDSKITFRFLV